MRKNMEADIRAQLEANMALLGQNSESWDQRVSGSLWVVFAQSK